MSLGTWAPLPPLVHLRALVYQNRPATLVRPTMGAFLFFGAGISILALMGAGRFGWIDFLFGVLLLPPLFLGFWLSRYVLPFVDKGYIKKLILTLTAIAALFLFVKSFLNLVS